MESIDKKSKFSIKRLVSAFFNSISGLILAYKSEQSMVLLAVGSLIVIILGIVLQISRLEWIIIILLICLTTTVELINTAIENVVDLATQKIHPLAKAAKDTASAAEFLILFMSVIISLLVFVPRIINLF